MFYFNFSTNAQLSSLEAASNGCMGFLQSIQNEEITFLEACLATKHHRNSLSLVNSLPPLFISLPEPLMIGAVTVAGYWLFHANKDNLTGFVAVPAYIDEKKDLIAIVPPNGQEQNAAGLEIKFFRPCPPPVPCPQDTALASDDGFLLRFN